MQLNKKIPFLLLFSSTSYTTAAYGSNPNVFIRLDTPKNFGAASIGSGSYATIASFQKVPLSGTGSLTNNKNCNRRSPSPYATSQLTGNIYSKPNCQSRFSYYGTTALSQTTNVSLQFLFINILYFLARIYPIRIQSLTFILKLKVCLSVQ